MVIEKDMWSKDHFTHGPCVAKLCTLRMLALLVFLAALLLRMVYLVSHWSLLPDWHVDAIGYHQLAVNVIERGTFSLNTESPFQPDSIRTPAYPIVIALVYCSVGIMPRAVLIAQSILDAITALIVVGIGVNLKLPKHIAIVVGSLYAFYPTAWRYSAEFYVEVVLAFTIALLFWMLSRQGTSRASISAVGLGVVCGIGILIKPSLTLLPIILGGVLSVKRRFPHVLAFGAALGVVLVPWVIRNMIVFDRPMVSTTFENNLARVSAPATLAELEGEDVKPWSPRWEALFLQVVETAAHENPSLFAIPSSEMTPRQLDQLAVELAKVSREIVISHPKAFLIAHVKGVARGLLPQEYRSWFEKLSGQSWESIMPNGMASFIRDRGWRSVPLLALLLFVVFFTLYAVVYITMVIGLWRLSHHDQALAWAIGLFVVYMVILPGPIAYERFRVPIMPLAFASAGCAIGSKKPGLGGISS